MDATELNTSMLYKGREIQTEIKTTDGKFFILSTFALSSNWI
jgi:hypothetical protein